MYVDTDTHYWPLRFLERVPHPGRGHIEMRDGKAWYYRDGELVHSIPETRWNVDRRYDVMDREGFDVQVLIPDNRHLIYELEPALGTAMASAHNDTVAEDLVGTNRFIGVAWVYLPDVPNAVRELRRSVEELGLGAVKVMGGFGTCDLDHETLWPFYEEAERLDIPILVHPSGRGFRSQTAHPWLVGAERFEGYRNFVSALGFPFTYMLTAARLIFSGTLDRFPTLRFAFFEGGVGWVPFLKNHLDHYMPIGDATWVVTNSEAAQAAAVYRSLRRMPSEYFDQLYIAAVAWEANLPETVRAWPNHNIMIASDFDHPDPISTWPNTIAPLRAMTGLSDEDKEKILGANAERLFGLDRHPDRRAKLRASSPVHNRA